MATKPSVRIRRFCSRRLIHGKGQFAGRPFTFEPWQDEAIEGVFDGLQLVRGRGEPDRALRVVREGLVGIGKKNGKSHIGAALGLYGLCADGHYELARDGWRWRPEYGAEVYNVAGSRGQAKVLFELGSGFVERDPMLRSMCKVYRDAVEVRETGSVWRVLASDAKLAHGPNPSMVIIDEIWVHRSPELYEAFASAGAARAQPLVLIFTTAGFDQRSIAWSLYQRGLKGGEPRFYFRWWQGPDGCRIEDSRALRKANPSRWVTLEYLRAELRRARALGLENQFRRFHLNQWTSAVEQAVPIDLWDANGGRPRIPKLAPVVVAVDSAPKRDSTGIVVDHRDAKGLHHVRHTKMKVDPDVGYLDFDALEELLRELGRTYDVQRILVDPFAMIRSMLTLAEEGLPIEEFPQGDVRMVPASMNLYELLIAKRIRHGGDKELRAQVQAAAKRITERGWRFHKRTSSGSIDGLIALTMAAYEVERGAEEEPMPQLFV
ncbi:MAG TPA: terminase large subunit [Actinomycetota bacterium]|nr:terminase large subunit [Actinomycetota bacterium]